MARYDFSTLHTAELVARLLRQEGYRADVDGYFIITNAPDADVRRITESLIPLVP